MADTDELTAPDDFGPTENPKADALACKLGLAVAGAFGLLGAGVVIAWLQFSAAVPKDPLPKADRHKNDRAEVAKISPPNIASPSRRKKEHSPDDALRGLTPLMRYYELRCPGQPSAEVVREYLQSEGLQIPKLVSCNRPWKTLKFDGNKVYSLAFSPDGSKVAATILGDVSRLVVWDVAAAKRLLTMDGRRAEYFFHLDFSPDGRFLAAYKPLHDGSTLDVNGFTDWTPIIGVWEVETWKIVHEFKGFGHLFAFTPDGNSLVTPDRKDNLVFIDMPSGIRGTQLKRDSTVVDALAFSPDGHLLAYGCEDGTVKILDVASGKQKAVIKGYFQSGENLSLSFSPDGKLLAFSAFDLEAREPCKGVLLYDVAAHKVVDGMATWSRPWCCRFSPDGKTVAASSFGGIYLFDVATRKPGKKKGTGTISIDACWWLGYIRPPCHVRREPLLAGSATMCSIGAMTVAKSSAKTATIMPSSRRSAMPASRCRCACWPSA